MYSTSILRPLTPPVALARSMRGLARLARVLERRTGGAGLGEDVAELDRLGAHAGIGARLRTDSRGGQPDHGDRGDGGSCDGAQCAPAPMVHCPTPQSTRAPERLGNCRSRVRQRIAIRPRAGRASPDATRGAGEPAPLARRPRSGQGAAVAGGAVVVTPPVLLSYCAMSAGSPTSFPVSGFPPLSTLNLPSFTVTNQVQLLLATLPKPS